MGMNMNELLTGKQTGEQLVLLRPRRLEAPWSAPAPSKSMKTIELHLSKLELARTLAKIWGNLRSEARRGTPTINKQYTTRDVLQQ
jgi:hypothetical protein